MTTVVIGNCGFTIAPCRPAHRDLIVRNLTHVEGMSLEAMRAGIDWDFETYPEYLASLERRGMVPNVASFVGHSSVRTWVLGEEASRRAATEAEIAEMRRIVLEALRAGAIGFATSTLEQHNGENGVPMPSRLADEREMLALTGALGEAGRGVFMLTKGMTSTVPWLEKIAAANGRPVMIAAMFVDPGDPDARVPRARRDRGGPRARARAVGAGRAASRSAWSSRCAIPTRSRRFSPGGPPSWRRTRRAIARCSPIPRSARALKGEIGRPGVPNRFSDKKWDHLTIEEVRGPSTGLLGRTIGQLAREQRPRPVGRASSTSASTASSTPCSTAGCSTSTRTRCRSSCAIPTPPSRCPTPARTCPSSATRASACTCSATGCASAASLTLEQAVRSVTSAVAGAYRIADRGALVAGAWADLMLFDPKTVGRGPKRRVNDLPTGATPPRHARGGAPRRLGQRRAHGGRARRHARLRPPGGSCGLRDFGA